MQDHHSLVYREEEREMFPTLKHFGVGIIPWSPLARGLLSRPFKGDIRTTRGDVDRWVSVFPAAAWPMNPTCAFSVISAHLEGPGTQEIVNRSVAFHQNVR
jgi:aryl-alcohol dehydrogenase-like predicted oxidoreductase